MSNEASLVFINKFSMMPYKQSVKKIEVKHDRHFRKMTPMMLPRHP